MLSLCRSLVVLKVSDGAEGVGGWRGQSGVWPITRHLLPGCRHSSGTSDWWASHFLFSQKQITYCIHAPQRRTTCTTTLRSCCAGTGLIDESPLWSMSIKIWKTSPKHQHRQIQYLFVHHLVLPHLEASLDALTSIIKLFASKQISYWVIHMTRASSGTNTPAVWSLFTCYSYSTHHLLCTKGITTRIHKHTY